jgi:acyl-CoA synthetase (AMP-forming)/AMP-acid ligase II
LFRRIDPTNVRESLLSADSSLRILAFGGEAFPEASYLERCIESGNRTNIFNLYGITEVSCWGSAQLVRAPQRYEFFYEKNGWGGGVSGTAFIDSCVCVFVCSHGLYMYVFTLRTKSKVNDHVICTVKIVCKFVCLTRQIPKAVPVGSALTGTKIKVVNGEGVDIAYGEGKILIGKIFFRWLSSEVHWIV